MKIMQMSRKNLGNMGRLLPERPEQPGQIILLKLSDYVTRYMAEKTVTLDYESGMPLLVLYPETGPQIYYVDRAVTLEPGVLFSLLPVQKDSQVYFSGKGSLFSVDEIPARALEDPTPKLILEKLHTFFYQESSGNFYFRGERHEPYELVYVDRGSLHNLAGGQDILLKQQEMMILDSNTWHIQYSDEAVSFLTVSFTLSRKLPAGIPDRRLNLSPELRQLMTMLFREVRERAMFEESRESILRLLLVQLIREEIREPQTEPVALPATQSAENLLMDKAVQFISENISHRLTLEELTEELHVSVSYLCRLFARHLGMSPGQYITRIRLEECKSLLRAGHPMGVIADRMGFSSPQHFSKQFHAKVGLTPSQYARSLR